MKIYYIGGLYRAKTPRKILENIRHAETYAIEVWKTGNAALCPHLNTRLMDGICSDEIFLNGDIELLKRCDAMIVIPGWEKSVGTINELKKAYNALIEILFPNNLADVAELIR